jgi:hypothetical protein
MQRMTADIRHCSFLRRARVVRHSGVGDAEQIRPGIILSRIAQNLSGKDVKRTYRDGERTVQEDTQWTIVTR